MKKTILKKFMLSADVVSFGQMLPPVETDIAKITGRITIDRNPTREFRTASAGENFMGGLFGRDILKMMQHEMEHNPAFVRDGLLLLASLQGTGYNRQSEEEPGKILHELRSIHLPDLELNPNTRKLIASLGPLFGGDENGFISYVSADATGEFLKTAFGYMQITGDVSILNERVWGRDGQERTFQDALVSATNWVADTINYGPLHFNPDKMPKEVRVPHLLGWRSVSGNFINQQLRDSREANHFPNGELTNPNGTQYDTGMQAVAHDDLIAMATMLPNDSKSHYWRTTAKRLQEDTLKYLLNTQSHLFAMGADTDPLSGNIRRVDTQCISVADMLSSVLLRDGVSSEDFITIVSTHVRNFFGEDFWTKYGVRTESLLYWNLFESQTADGNPTVHSPYHGSSSVWDVMNGVLADVLVLLNLPKLSQPIDDAVYNANALTGCHSELKHVGQHHELGIDMHGAWSKIKPRFTLHTTNLPDFTQGWSTTNEIAAARRRRNEYTPEPGSWQDLLQREILTNLAESRLLPKRLETPEEVEAERERIEPLALNTTSGMYVQQAYLQRHGIYSSLELSAIVNQPSEALPATLHVA